MKVTTFFLPWKLTNQLNGSHGHWAPRAKDRKRLREASHVLARRMTRPLTAEASRPKRITFELRTWNPWDDDALAAACKPLRDGLMDAGVIHQDGPASGHRFVYTQSVARHQRGVWVTVEIA